MDVAPGEARGLTDLMRPFKRTAIARETGIVVKRVHNIANGVVEPTASEVPHLARALRVTVEQIVHGVQIDKARRHGGPRSVAV